MSLNLLAKMGFGALGGFEYVAIHAGARGPPDSRFCLVRASPRPESA